MGLEGVGRKERRKEGKKGREKENTTSRSYRIYFFSGVHGTFTKHDHILAHKENNLGKFKIEWSREDSLCRSHLREELKPQAR